MSKWKKIEDCKVRHIWECQEEDCSEDNMSCDVSPEWYEDNGTPVCGCGVDMVYVRTEIEVEE
jgi:hypothetical protein